MNKSASVLTVSKLKVDDGRMDGLMDGWMDFTLFYFESVKNYSSSTLFNLLFPVCVCVCACACVCVVNVQYVSVSTRKITSAKNQSTNTMRCVFNPKGVWPSQHRVSIYLKIIFSTPSSSVLLLGIVSLKRFLWFDLKLRSISDLYGKTQINFKSNILNWLYFISQVRWESYEQQEIMQQIYIHTETVNISVWFLCHGSCHVLHLLCPLLQSLGCVGIGQNLKNSDSLAQKSTNTAHQIFSWLKQTQR